MLEIIFSMEIILLLYFEGQLFDITPLATAITGATFTFNGSSDYIEVYGLHNYGSSRNFIGNSTTECVFTAYRLIGV